MSGIEDESYKIVNGETWVKCGGCGSYLPNDEVMDEVMHDAVGIPNRLELCVECSKRLRKILL